MTDNVFIALQNNSDAQPIIEAIVDMVKVDAPGRLVVKRETVEVKMGRGFDLQELHINLISLGGNIDEDDDEFVLSWGA
jgi:phenol hydroxylase P2 protein